MFLISLLLFAKIYTAVYTKLKGIHIRSQCEKILVCISILIWTAECFGNKRTPHLWMEIKVIAYNSTYRGLHFIDIPTSEKVMLQDGPFKLIN